MVAQSPKLIGIVGGSCAGKTWLAERLQNFLGEHATRITLDDFYHDRAYLSPGRRSLVNFDHPRAIDWDRVENVLRRFAIGATAPVPRYNFKTHGRTALESQSPGSVVIMDGLWLFRRPALRSLFDLKIFIRSSRSWCEEKRIERDTRERGRTTAQVRQQLQKFTFPMFERFIAPQENYADLVLESPITKETVQTLGTRIRGQLKELVGI